MGRVWNSTIDRKSPLKRGGRLRPFGRFRQRRRAKGEVYGRYHRFFEGLFCLVRAECAGSVNGHHVKTVAAGGKDYANEVPLCAKHHTEVHQLGRSRFERRYQVDLTDEAARAASIVDRWFALTDPRVRQLWEGR
jgi:hypothetical protein